MANSLQNALNSAWEIPFARRPGFPWSWLRSAALIIVIGVGFIGTTIISGLAAGPAACCQVPAHPCCSTRYRWC